MTIFLLHAYGLVEILSGLASAQNFNWGRQVRFPVSCIYFINDIFKRVCLKFNAKSKRTVKYVKMCIK